MTDVPDFLGHERRADELRSPPTISGSEKDAALEQFAHTSKLQLPVSAFGSSVNTLKKKAIPLECNQMMMREWARKGKGHKKLFHFRHGLFKTSIIHSVLSCARQVLPERSCLLSTH